MIENYLVRSAAFHIGGDVLFLQTENVMACVEDKFILEDW